MENSIEGIEIIAKHKKTQPRNHHNLQNSSNNNLFIFFRKRIITHLEEGAKDDESWKKKGSWDDFVERMSLRFEFERKEKTEKRVTHVFVQKKYHCLHNIVFLGS